MTVQTKKTRAAPIIAVIIVNYRTPTLALEAADSLSMLRKADPSMRVIIADGCSDDGSVEALEKGLSERGLNEWVFLLPLQLNGGFGWANNQAILHLLRSSLPPDYIYLLNPDARATAGAVSALIDVLDQFPTCAAVGSLLLNEDGTPSGSAFRFPSIGREFLRGIRTAAIGRAFGIAPTLIEMDEAGEADWVTGASVMLRADALIRVGLFDTGFFLYFEEVELMYRFARAGWTVWHQPKSRVLHIGGAATGLSYNRRSVAIGPPLPRYWFASRRRCLALISNRRTAFLAGLAWVTGHIFYKTRSALGSPGSQFQSRREARDVLRYGLMPDSVDQTPDESRWDDPPGLPPAWTLRHLRDRSR